MQSASEKKTETARREKNARRRLFCYLLARLGNSREAAVGAGYPRGEAHLHAARLLGQKRVVRLVSHYARMDRGQRNWGQALQGLWRLAFGEVNDAVSLLMAGEEPVNVSGLDLFAVSEIRRPRGGRLRDQIPRPAGRPAGAAGAGRRRPGARQPAGGPGAERPGAAG